MAERPLLTAFRCRCTLLMCSRSATAALRVVSCRAAVHSLCRRRRPEHSLTLAPGLPGEPGNVGWPRTFARGPGRTLRPDHPQNHWPTQPGVPPAAGNENKARNPKSGATNRSTGPPTATRLDGWLIAVRSPPWPRPSRPVDTKSMCPLSVLPSPRAPVPPEWRCRPSGGPQLKFGGKGGLRAP